MIEIQCDERISDERMKEIFKVFRKRAKELEKSMSRPADVISKHEQDNEAAFNAYKESLA